MAPKLNKTEEKGFYTVNQIRLYTEIRYLPHIRDNLKTPEKDNLRKTPEKEAKVQELRMLLLS